MAGFKYLMRTRIETDDGPKAVLTPIELGAVLDPGAPMPFRVEDADARQLLCSFPWPKTARLGGEDLPLYLPQPSAEHGEDGEDAASLIHAFFDPYISARVRFAGDKEPANKGPITLDGIGETTTFRVFVDARRLVGMPEEEARALPSLGETLEGSFCRTIASRIVASYAATQPQFWHYGPARAFLLKHGDVGAGEDDASRFEDAVLALGAALCRTCARLFTMAQVASREHASEETTAIVRDGMLLMDSVLCELLEELGEDAREVEKGRSFARERLAQHPAREFGAWSWWFKEAPEDHADGPGRMRAQFIELLLWTLWSGIKEQLDRGHEEGTPDDIPQALLQGLHHKGSNYGKLDRIGSAVGAWSGGTTGRVVNVQHSTYEPLPFLVTLQHQASELLTTQGNKPHQTHIEVVLPRKRSSDIDKTEMAMTHNEFLSYIYALQVTPKTGTRVQQTLDAFIRGIKPGINRIRKRDREEAIDILQMLNRIQLKTKASTGDLFDIVYPSDADSDDPIQWRWGLQAEVVYEKLGSRLKGWAPINRDALYGFNGNQSAHARLYVFLCSMWNDAKDLMTKTFSPDAVPIYSIEDLCLFTSLFNEHALSYRRGETKIHTHHSKAKAKMRDILEELARQDGERPPLVVLDIVKKKRGVMEEVRVLPTEEHIEAMTRIRNERSLMSN